MPVNIEDVKFRMLGELEKFGSIQLSRWLEDYHEHASEIAQFAFWAELSSLNNISIDDDAWEDERGVASATLSFWHSSLDDPDIIPPTLKDQLRESRNRIRARASGKTSVEFKKASVIAWIVDQHGKPVSRYRVHKEAYTLERCLNLGIFSGYQKMPLGPYDPKLKYRDGEPIAKKQKMLQIRGHIMTAGQEIEKCRKYAPGYLVNTELAQILIKYLSRLNDEELETLTTVDAICLEISHSPDESLLETIKTYLQASREWRSKLSKRAFTDSEINTALFRLNSLGII